jgi:hypothetical protein
MLVGVGHADWTSDSLRRNRAAEDPIDAFTMVGDSMFEYAFPSVIAGVSALQVTAG